MHRERASPLSKSKKDPSQADESLTVSEPSGSESASSPDTQLQTKDPPKEAIPIPQSEQLAQQQKLIIAELRAVVTNIHIHMDGEVPLEMLGPMEIARPGTIKDFSERYLARIDLEHFLATSDNMRKNIIVIGIFVFLFGLLGLGFYALNKGFEWAGVSAIAASGVGLATVLIQSAFKGGSKSGAEPDEPPAPTPRKKTKPKK